MVSSRSEGYPKPFPNREDILTLASVPVPLLDSTTQVCWKSDNLSPPDTNLISPRTQYGAIRSTESRLDMRILQPPATPDGSLVMSRSAVRVRSSALLNALI